MPFNRLSFTQEAINNLTSKSDTAHFEWIDGIRQGFTAKKMSIFELINGVVSTSGYDMYIPLLYEGEDFYIDITINSIYFDDLLIELKSLGINILKDQKEFEVLVIRDNEAEIL